MKTYLGKYCKYLNISFISNLCDLKKKCLSHARGAGYVGYLAMLVNSPKIEPGLVFQS